jgi:uncharacterized protein (DUF433 family)
VLAPAQTLVIHNAPIPLFMDQEGRARIIGTRVTLDTVVEAFEQGATPEEIALEYPTLQPADIYMVIGYYLHHRDAVQEYLQAQDAAAEQGRQEMVARFHHIGLKERLLARRTAQDS